MATGYGVKKRNKLAKQQRSRVININLPVLHAPQRKILSINDDGKLDMEKYHRFVVCACGRRFGKSLMQAHFLSTPMIEGGLPVAYFVPDYKRMTEFWDIIINLFGEGIETGGAIIRSNMQERLIKIANGGSIEMWTCEDENAGVSRKYFRVGIDEAALIPQM